MGGCVTIYHYYYNFSYIMNAFEENWREVLHQQNLVHEGELQKWNTILQAAVKMLKKVSIICRDIFDQDKWRHEQLHEDL